MRQILIVDDEPNILNALQRLLEEEGMEVYRASSGAEGLDILRDHPGIGVVLSDQRMPQMTGIDFLRHTKVNYPNKVRMILSGYSELQTLTEAINEGSIFKFVCKPWDDDQLINLVREAFEYHELTEQNRILSQQLLDSNQELERLNRHLESRIEEKTHALQLHLASLHVYREAIEHLPYAILGLDNELCVVMENEAARTTLSKSSASILGLPLVSAIKEELSSLADSLMDFTAHTDTAFFQPTADINFHVRRLAAKSATLGLILIAIPNRMIRNTSAHDN